MGARGIEPSLFDAGTSHVRILRVNGPQEDTWPPRGVVSPQGML